MIVPDQPNQPTPNPSAPEPAKPNVEYHDQLFSKRSKKISAAKPGMSPQELLDLVVSQDQDDIIPWEDARLPSRGVYYGGKIPDGVVQVRAMGLYADKILATQRLAKSGKSLDWLYRKCVRFPSKDFDPLDLLANDRTFLLYYLRGITHGNEYDFLVECTDPECGQIGEQFYDLNKLAGTIKGPNTELGDEPFKIVLPHYSEIMGQEFWVKVRFLRGRDVFAMMDLKIKNKNKRPAVPVKRDKDLAGNVMPSLDETLEQNLNLLIVEAMGVSNPVKIRALVERMQSTDTATIREFLRAHTPGIETTVKLECEYCGHEMSMDLPITDSFFRPKRTGANRA
jgi:hypothetical protein